MEIVKLRLEHARQVAKLHIAGISTGFISSLGIDFVSALYESIAKSEYGFGLVARRGDRVVAFVAFTTNILGLYRSVLFKSGLRLALILVGKLCSPARVKSSFETLFYPSRIARLDLPRAELLSIVVAEPQRGRGLAEMLVRQGLAQCRQADIEHVKVLVAADNTVANRLYRKCGFSLAGQIDNHGVLSNIYVGRTDYDMSPQLALEERRRESLSSPEAVAGRPIAQTGGRGDRADSKVANSVFITYAWCRTAYAAVLSLGRRGIDVHASDASGLAMSRWSRYCLSFTRVPDFFIEPDAYFEATCQALKKTGPIVLLPSHEDVGIFCRRKNELPDNVRVALPDWQTYRTVEDKLTVLDVARKAGCPTPWAVEVESESQLDEFGKSAKWPVVIKTRITNSAKGVRIARNGSELRGKFMELVQTYDLAKDRWPILQQYLPGEAAGVCLLYQNGKCVASFGERYLRCKEPDKFGTSTLRESYPNQDLIDRAIRVMDKSHWHGVVHLDFVADEDGVFRLIEINPRLWGALAMSLFAGVDFPYMWYLTALGEPITEQADVDHRPVKCRWIVGDSMALLELLKHRRFSEAARVFLPGRKCYHDDFVLTDPFTLSFEIADYITKFVKAGCSMNPVTHGMVR